jgi:hypothetical protein
MTEEVIPHGTLFTITLRLGSISTAQQKLENVSGIYVKTHSVRHVRVSHGSEDDAVVLLGCDAVRT